MKEVRFKNEVLQQLVDTKEYLVKNKVSQSAKNLPFVKYDEAAGDEQGKEVRPKSCFDTKRLSRLDAQFRSLSKEVSR